MDRKGWLILILCAAGLAINFWWMTEDAKKVAEQRQQQEDRAEKAVPSNPVMTEAGSDPEMSTDGEDVPLPTPSTFEESFETLTAYATDYADAEKVIYIFTNRGGGLARIEYPDDYSNAFGSEVVSINNISRTAIGALTNGSDIERGQYEVSARGENFIEYRGKTFQGIVATKRYELAADGEGRNYRLKFSVKLELPGEGQVSTGMLGLHLGAIGPETSKEAAQLVGFGWKNEEDEEFTASSKFEGGWFSSDSASIDQSVPNPTWVALMSQFYTLIYSPVEEDGELRLRAKPLRFTVPGIEEDDEKEVTGVSVGISLGELSLNKDSAPKELAFEVYAGPKNYDLLKRIGGERNEVLFYGDMPVIGWMAAPFSRLLNLGMHSIQNVTVNYGIAIICVTLLIRICLWPLYTKSQKTMKRMAKIGPMVKELKEKYPDDPQKLNQKTMELYKDYGVSPLGGCLPMFLQMPIFFGFYRMLQYAAELRHESFLWVNDLSQPDTIFHIPGLEWPVNVLPILMAVSMFFQMKMTPKQADNAQQKIMMFLPFVFLFICYSFASALALYWTTQNIFSIGQTWWANRQPEVELVKKKRTKRPSLAELQKQRAASARGESVDDKPKKKRPPRLGGR